jgi:hypothetical protein
VKRRLTFIAVWGLSCIVVCMTSVVLMVYMNGLMYWFVPVAAVGLPTIGLLLAFLGLLPGTRPAQGVFVRVLPPGAFSLQRVQAVQIKSRFYRIITPNAGDEPWEFTTGDLVECAERDLPNGERGLLAILRVSKYECV